MRTAFVPSTAASGRRRSPTLRAVADDPASAARVQAADRAHAHRQGGHGRPRGGVRLQPSRRATKARTVHTYHGHSLEGYFRYAGAFIAIERLLARATDRLIAISPRIEAELRDRYRIGRPRSMDRRAARLRPGAARSPSTPAARAAARRALGLDPAAPVVTIVGRLTAIKQHELFLRVARAVHEQRPSAIFAIVGDGERRGEMEALAASLGLDGSRALSTAGARIWRPSTAPPTCAC